METRRPFFTVTSGSAGTENEVLKNKMFEHLQTRCQTIVQVYTLTANVNRFLNYQPHHPRAVRHTSRGTINVIVAFPNSLCE